MVMFMVIVIVIVLTALGVDDDLAVGAVDANLKEGERRREKACERRREKAREGVREHTRWGRRCLPLGGCPT